MNKVADEEQVVDIENENEQNEQNEKWKLKYKVKN